MDYKHVDLQSLNNGALQDLFSEELEKVLENIADPNTGPEATRSITLKVDIKPQKDRLSAVTKVSVTSKMAPSQPHVSFVHFDHDGAGNLFALTANPKQQELPMEENIRSMEVNNGR